MSTAALRFIDPAGAASTQALQTVTPRNLRNTPFGMTQEAFSSPAGTNDVMTKMNQLPSQAVASASSAPTSNTSGKTLLGS